MPRKLGKTINPRDERGWQIPREGTKRRKIYELLVAGVPQQNICNQLDISKENFQNARRYITKPDHTNALQRARNNSERGLK